jgi:hypothetical protein
VAKWQQYIPLGGKSERYRNLITNEEISSRQYRKLRRDAIAGRDPVIDTTPDFDTLDAYLFQKTKQGQSVDPQKASRSRELRAIVAGLKDTTGEYMSTFGEKLYPPDSPKSRALILLGRREPEWDFAVGETPTR